MSDNNEKELKYISPFKYQLLQSFPFIAEDFDQLTAYQLFCKLVEKINEVIGNENTITTEVNEIKDYLDTLDFQDEVNQKLDEMAEDGTLENIIGSFIAEYQDFVHVASLGAIGDGTTDNSEILQNIINTYDNIYVDVGEYYFSTTLQLKENTTIKGVGTLKGNIEIVGEIGEVVNYTSLDKNKINGANQFNINDMLLVYYEETETPSNNKRQIVVTSSVNGKLSNNLCNYNNNYSIRKIESIKNIKLYDIKIIGNITINYSQDIYFDKITLKNGTLSIKSSYNINIINSILELGNNNRIDGNSGSSNLTFNNLKFLGGNTPSDNGALKLNEVFYSNINNCNFGSPANEISGYTGNFHAIMIDGNFAENNYPLNHTQYIDINNIKVADGYTNSLFITLGKNINVNNFEGDYIHLKYSDFINVVNSITNILNNEIENTNLNFTNCNIKAITSGTRQNMNFVNCVIDDIALAKDTNNNNFINCKINKLRNTYINADSAKNIHFENCEIFETCQLSGINKCTGSIKSHVYVQVNQLNNSNVSILIVDNNSTTYNLSLQNCDNSKIFYQILEDALTSTPVNNLANGLSNKIETINLVMSNNPNNNVTQSILKANAIPSTRIPL